MKKPKFCLAVHGGAGTIDPSLMTPAREKAYHLGLTRALEAGYACLHQGKSSLDAVEAAVKVLEDNPLFNAGRGSVFTFNEQQEMDAAIMNGNGLGAGAVASVQGVKNPVSLARAVMEQSGHVMLSGAGALAFARDKKLKIMPEEYFYTAERHRQWKEAQQEGGYFLDHRKRGEKKFGTVGAVALDAQGNLAAATSTGGMTNKRFGRIGDTPLIGAGTYAHNDTCAVSCTGHGEFFIRVVAAHEVSSLMAYKKCSLAEACRQVVHQQLMAMGGEGGLIAISKTGQIELCFNTSGMYRGYRVAGGKPHTRIYAD